jgi:uncharacterized protein
MSDEIKEDLETSLEEPDSKVSPLQNPPLVTLLTRKSKPRFFPGEATLWCLLFLIVQIMFALIIAVIAFFAFALGTDDPRQFLHEQLTEFEGDNKKDEKPNEPSITGEMWQAMAYGSLGAQFASLGLIFIALPWRIGRDWKRQIALRRPAVIHVLLIFLIVPGFIVLTSGIGEFLQEVCGIKLPATGKAMSETFRSFPLILTLLAVAVGPGVVEEIWFRGFLGRGLTARYGLVAGIVISSTMFGLAHGSRSYAIPTSIMGAYLYFVYRTARSLWVSVLLHFLNNGFAVLAMAGGIFSQMDTDTQEPGVWLYLASFSLVLFGSIALWTSRSKVVVEPDSQENSGVSPLSTWQPEYPGISVPPRETGLQLRSSAVSPAALFLTFASFAIVLALMFG